MRDNAKGGALTEVTFFILLSLYTCLLYTSVKNPAQDSANAN